MLFQNKYIIKVYHEGQIEPFITFLVKCQSIRVTDCHTLNCDGTTMTFANNEYPAVIADHTE